MLIGGVLDHVKHAGKQMNAGWPCCWNWASFCVEQSLR